MILLQDNRTSMCGCALAINLANEDYLIIDPDVVEIALSRLAAQCRVCISHPIGKTGQKLFNRDSQLLEQLLNLNEIIFRQNDCE